MTNIKLIVSGPIATAEVEGVMTSGMVGIPVTIAYDSIWSGLRKNLVCRAGQWYGPFGDETRTILNVENSAVVAHEVMIAGRYLYLGVEGYSPDGELVIPTVWANCGRICAGADSDADPSADPTLPVWAQLQEQIETLREKDLKVTMTDFLDTSGTGVEITVRSGDSKSSAKVYDGKNGTSAYASVETDQDGTVTITTKDATGTHTATITRDDHFVTPQMFGAVGNGIADDTKAVQAALDHGGLIFFPAGRYKVTGQLTAVKSGRIMMIKPYPCTYGADYPLTAEDNWMGARIETYSTDGYGLLVGDGVEIDGLYMRAMDTFEGVLFKFDGTLGCATYPSQVRLSHIRLDNHSFHTVPEAMFDFVPAGSYFGILDDITIGSLRGRQFCRYGFRSVMATTDAGWGNSMRIRNLCVDLLADYAIYIEGGPKGAGNWVLENPTVQTYPYVPDDEGYIGKTGHINLVTLKNMQHPLILGGALYDMHAATVTGTPILLENTTDVSCFGCDSWFDSIDMVLTEKLQKAADSLNIETLTMSVAGVAETGANRLTLSDGTNRKDVDIPAVSISDEQLDQGIAKWFHENAAPDEQVGRNKFNPNAADTVHGYFYGDWGFESGGGWTTTNYIAVKTGDVLRFSKAGLQMSAYFIYYYDAEKKGIRRILATDSAAPRTIEDEGVAYVRICWSSAYFTYENRETAEICVTVNDSDVSYEPYGIELVGGIGSFVVLQSPNGTQFTLCVADDGTVSATPC